MPITKPHFPSAQHLARMWEDSPEKTCKSLVKMVDASPPFSYARILPLISELLAFGTPIKRILLTADRQFGESALGSNAAEILPLIDAQVQKRKFHFAHPVAGRKYPLSRDLAIAFNPPVVCGDGSDIVFPWFSLWRTNPLNGERLSLFVSLITDMLLQDPDLDAARFEIWDLSAPSKGEARVLRVTDAAEIPLLTSKRKEEMLNTFVAGFELARSYLINRNSNAPSPKMNGDVADSKSGDLFNDR